MVFMTDNFYEALLLAEENFINSIPEVDDEPVVFSKRHQRAMKKLFNKMRGGRYHRYTRAGARALLVAAVMLSLTITAFAVPTSREYILSKFAIFSSYELSENADANPVNDITIGYMPEGFVKSYEDVGKYKIMYEYNYEDKFISITKGDLNSITDFDTENFDSEVINFNGIVYIYHHSYNEYNGVVWNDGMNIYTLSSNLDKEEILEIAKNIK